MPAVVFLTQSRLHQSVSFEKAGKISKFALLKKLVITQNYLNLFKKGHFLKLKTSAVMG
ncbi:hypothetical protein CLOSTHATH_00758 [Hungatella hathewayi DSM 13479]|uniref:Uncharacterized protein n=1 Tax=Hungatella hathewayi DSM 13479 TaxID=566550 RepID=D3AAY7_9FIRM|nr:hypothetical protein CLOSTHATH_00758 [Hungatella hathewayi DSM 13479]